MRSRYKKFKEAEFFTRTDKFCCWSSRYKKFKEAEYFTRTDKFCCALSLRVYLLLCKYYREDSFNAFSIQKIQRGQIFLLELTGFVVHCHFEFICFFANIIEKCFLMRSRYKKFKEAEFFTRTDKFCCWSSRYKKFKETKFFNEQI